MLLSSLFALLLPALALTSPSPRTLERLSDAEVRRLMENAVRGIERVEESLPASPARLSLEPPPESPVASLSSLVAELGQRGSKMLSRFSDRYPANSEVLSFLRLGSVVDARAGELPRSARREWDGARFEVAGLAGAYGVAWSGEPARWRAYRMTDAEVKRAIVSLEIGTRELKRELEQELGDVRGLSRTARKRLLERATQLHHTAESAREHFARGGDLTDELRHLATGAREIAAVFDQNPLGIQLQALWQAVEWDIALLHDAFARADLRP